MRWNLLRSYDLITINLGIEYLKNIWKEFSTYDFTEPVYIELPLNRIGLNAGQIANEIFHKKYLDLDKEYQG